MVKFIGLLLVAMCISANGLESSRRLVLDSSESLSTVDNLQLTVNQLKAEMKSLKSAEQSSKAKISKLEAQVLKSSQLSTLTTGSTYIRWGKMSCPGNGSELVYTGYMAGNMWNQYGGGANHLCLPDNPSWAYYDDTIASGGTIHGTEFESNGNPELLTTLFGSDISNEDPSCAVCKTSRMSHLMIPARAKCYDGWTLEYQGYVVAAAERYRGSSEFVCLDANPDLVPHGHGNDEEHILYVVEAQCGSTGGLPCPPYVQGRELACVVCSQ